jgi:hypothetical protein
VVNVVVRESRRHVKAFRGSKCVESGEGPTIPKQTSFTIGHMVWALSQVSSVIPINSKEEQTSPIWRNTLSSLSRYYMCHRTKIEAITPRQRRSRPRLESWAESQVGAGVCDHRRYPYGTEKHIYLISSTADLKLHTTSLVHGEMRRKRAPLWQGQRCWWLYPSPETSDEVLDSHRH